MSLAGCALSPEQLTLPRSLSGSPSDPAVTGSIGPRNGVPLGEAADPGTTKPRLYEGTGRFVSPGTGEAGSERAYGKIDQNGVTLNLVGASVQEVAKTVLGDILGVNYTVSDKVKASITLSTAHPVSKEDLLRIFESILRSEGIGLSVEGNLYRILPADAAGGPPPRWSSRDRGPKAGASTMALPLRYISAAEMERILKAVAPSVSILRVDSARNLLLVSGLSQDLASVRETADTFDLDWMRGMSFGLLPVESGDPEAIAKELDTIFANDSDSPTKGIVRFIPNTRLKSVLVISSRPEYLRKAEGWLRRIDLAGQATERQIHVYNVRNRPADELALLLQKVYKAQTGGRDSGELALQPRQPPAVINSDGANGDLLPGSGFPTGLGAPPRAAARRNGPVIADQGAETDEAEPAQQTAGGANPNGDQNAGISVVADERNNALIITATSREFQRMRQILARIDTAANQVLLEATIAEVTLNDQLRFGLKWYFEQGNNHAIFSPDSAAGLTGVVPSFPGFSYFFSTPNVRVALDALNRVTTTNVVSSPSLMVLDNKKALLQIGDEVPIATQQATSVISPGAPVVNSISMRSTGVILGITPRVGDNGRILLDIDQEVSEAKRSTESSDLDSPTISQRRVRTTVAVNDGETILLAGLMRDQTRVEHSKVPLVGDLPVVGSLFKNKTDNIDRTELFIAITPQVVRDPRQIRNITDEFRDRLNLTTRPQRGGPPDRRENIDRLTR